MDLGRLTERCLEAISSHVTEAISVTSQGGPKRPCAVVIDPSLLSLLTLASPFPTNSALASSVFLRMGAMREFTVQDGVQIDWIEDGPVVCFLRPNPETTRKLSRQLRACQSQRRSRLVAKAVFVPRRSFRCELVLKEENVAPFFTLGYHSVSLGFVNAEPDLLTLELPRFLYETRVEEDTSAYSVVARALLDFGEISAKKIKGKGSASREIFELYMRMRDELDEAKRVSSYNPAKETKQGINEDSLSSPAGGEVDSQFSSAVSQLRNSLSWLLDEDFGSSQESAEFVTLTAPQGPLDPLGGYPRPFSKPEHVHLPSVDCVLLLDREIDMISPLMTPLTYEALLDETLRDKESGQITSNQTMEVKSSLLRLDEQAQLSSQGEDDRSKASLNQQMNSINLRSDNVYQMIRGESVMTVMQHLNQYARELKEEQERIHRMTDPEELQRMVNNVPKLQQRKRELTTHIALSQRVTTSTLERRNKATIDAERRLVFDIDPTLLLDRVLDCAARGESLFKALRMLCLSCIIAGGFEASTLNEYRRDLLHTYGFQHMLTLEALERTGMLVEPPFHPQHKFRRNEQQRLGKSSSSCVYRNFSHVKTAFRLVADDSNAASSTQQAKEEVAYVFSGIAPLSVRLVELEAMEGGWERNQEKLAYLGEHPTFIPAYSPSSSAPSGTDFSTTSSIEKKTMLVVYVGGVSRVEIAALRALSASPRCPYRIIIATTAILTGTEFIKSCSHPASFSSTPSTLSPGPSRSPGLGGNPFG